MKINKRLSALTTIIILQTVFFAYSASAQYKDINSISITAKTLLRNLGVHAADIVSIIVGIVAIVMLVPTVVKHIKGDAQSADAFLKNGSGIFMAFVIIEFCRMFFT